jgi:hypothetical protein
MEDRSRPVEEKSGNLPVRKMEWGGGRSIERGEKVVPYIVGVANVSRISSSINKPRLGIILCALAMIEAHDLQDRLIVDV